jgi:hypothetical protein
MKCPKCGRDPHPDGVGNLCVECGLPITCPSCAEKDAVIRELARRVCLVKEGWSFEGDVNKQVSDAYEAVAPRRPRPAGEVKER